VENSTVNQEGFRKRKKISFGRGGGEKRSNKPFGRLFSTAKTPPAVGSETKTTTTDVREKGGGKKTNSRWRGG